MDMDKLTAHNHSNRSGEYLSGQLSSWENGSTIIAPHNHRFVGK